MAQQRRSVLIHSKINDQLERITTLLGSESTALDLVQKEDEADELTRLETNSKWYMKCVEELTSNNDMKISPETYIKNLNEIKSNFQKWVEYIKTCKRENIRALTRYSNMSDLLTDAVLRINATYDPLTKKAVANIDEITKFLETIEQRDIRKSNGMEYTPRTRKNQRPEGWVNTVSQGEPELPEDA